MKQKIIICGGHFTPAYALINALQVKKMYEIHYIGRKTAFTADSASTLEYITLKTEKVFFHSLIFSKLQRDISFQSVFLLLRFPVSLIQSIILLFRIRPAIVVTFGGYIALPVCLGAWILGVPIVTHEQTFTLGLANRIVASIAQLTVLTWKNTRMIPKTAKIEVIGNIWQEAKIEKSDGEGIVKFGNLKLPLLYITGGSLGSHSLNLVIAEIISEITKNYRVLHQTGNACKKADYDYLLSLSKKVLAGQRENYKIVQFLSRDEVDSVLNNAYIVISRSGANTVFEIARHSLPAIFFPLPWAADGEQLENAKRLKNLGSAIILEDQFATADNLLRALNEMNKNYENYKKNAKLAKREYCRNGVKRLIAIIDQYKKTGK